MFFYIIFMDTNVSAIIVWCVFDSSMNCQFKNLSFDIIYYFKFVKVLIDIYVNLHNLLHFLSYSIFDAIFNTFQMANNIPQLHCIFVFFAYYNLPIK